jgi:hypothetical protein
MPKESSRGKLTAHFWIKIPLAILTAMGVMILYQRLFGLSDAVALSLMGTTIFLFAPPFVAEYQVRHAKLMGGETYERMKADAESRRLLSVHAKVFPLITTTVLGGYFGLYTLISGHSIILGIVSLVIGLVAMVPLASGWKILIARSDL